MIGEGESQFPDIPESLAKLQALSVRFSRPREWPSVAGSNAIRHRTGPAIRLNVRSVGNRHVHPLPRPFAGFEFVQFQQTLLVNGPKFPFNASAALFVSDHAAVLANLDDAVARNSCCITKVLLTGDEMVVAVASFQASIKKYDCSAHGHGSRLHWQSSSFYGSLP
jgi:hypothetical protein